MKRVYLTERSKMLHVEAPGCIINVRAGLADREGHKVVSIEILANGARYSGDIPWWIEGERGDDCRNIRIVECRQTETTPA